MAKKFFAALGFSLLLSACTIAPDRTKANARDGLGYPTDTRFFSLCKDHKPLNGLKLGQYEGKLYQGD